MQHLVRFLAGVAITLAMYGCRNGTQSPASPTTTDQPQIAVSYTNSSDIGIVAGDRNGDRFGVMTTTASSGLITAKGMTFRSAEGHTATLFLGPEGRPIRAVLGDVIVIFENYRANLVDVAVVGRAGLIAVRRGVEVDPAVFARPSVAGPQNFKSGVGLSAEGPFSDLARLLEWGAVVFKWGLCVASGSTMTPLALVPCASAVLATIVLFNPEMAALAAADWVIDVFGCAGGNAIACVNGLVDGLIYAVEIAEAALEEFAPEILDSIERLLAGPIMVAIDFAEAPAHPKAVCPTFTLGACYLDLQGAPYVENGFALVQDGGYTGLDFGWGLEGHAYYKGPTAFFLVSPQTSARFSQRNGSVFNAISIDAACHVVPGDSCPYNPVVLTGVRPNGTSVSQSLQLTPSLVRHDLTKNFAGVQSIRIPGLYLDFDNLLVSTP